VFMRGSCTNCNVRDNTCRNKHIYCYNCFGDSIAFNKGFDDANGVQDEVFILCGGDATPSAPTAPGADLGCSNCMIEGNTYQQANTLAGGIFSGGCVACLYCMNCTQFKNKCTLNDPTQLAIAAAFSSSYCQGCDFVENTSAGSCALGIYACDFYTIGVQCRDSTIVGNKISNVYQGISVLRCTGSLVLNNHVSRCTTGIVVSEGATDTVVRDNTVQNCTVQGLYSGVWTPPGGTVAGLFPPFSDSLGGGPYAPVNTNLIDNSFHSTVGGIVEPTVTVKTGFNVVN